MTPTAARTFVTTHGIVLEAGTGPVASLAAAVTGAPIRGSWWAHPEAQRIFAASRAIRESPEVLVCRLVGGKITYVHRRLWPALVRVAQRFPAADLAQVNEVHTATGKHVTEEIPFPDWVPPAVAKQARGLDEDTALRLLGAWSFEVKAARTATRRKKPSA